MEQAEKKVYEIGFMARNEKGVAEVVEHVKKHGGEVVLEGAVEEMALSYPIKKQSQAHFGYLHFSADPAEIKPLNDELERVTDVLRFLIITPPFEKQKPRTMPPDRVRPGQSPRPQQMPIAEKKPVAPLPLSNEALEKKIEEILQQS